MSQIKESVELNQIVPIDSIQGSEEPQWFVEISNSMDKFSQNMHNMFQDSMDKFSQNMHNMFQDMHKDMHKDMRDIRKELKDISHDMRDVLDCVDTLAKSDMRKKEVQRQLTMQE